MSNVFIFVVEIVLLEFDVEGEKSGKEIILEVDESKYVVLEKMNGMNYIQTSNYISCLFIKDWYLFCKKCIGT